MANCLNILSPQTEKLEVNSRQRVPAHFRDEARGCEFLVLWLDCDLEGENICFEVMKTACCKDDDYNSPLVKNKNVYRASFSALDPESLKKAYWGLQGRPNRNEADAVDARQELDLRIGSHALRSCLRLNSHASLSPLLILFQNSFSTFAGCAWTRFQTQFFQGRFRDLDASLVSYGPCQTPTLWFCVQRQDEIDAFKPEKFYILKSLIKMKTIFDGVRARMNRQDPQCRNPSSQEFRQRFQQWEADQRQHHGQRDETLEMEWTKGPIFSKECIEGLKSMLFVDAAEQAKKANAVGDRPNYHEAAASGSGEAPKACLDLNRTYQFLLDVTQCSTKEAASQRPQGMNTVQMLKLASSSLGMGPHEAMKEAESLYLRGYLTYPRTETTTYPPGLDLDALLRGQCRNPIWGNQAIQLTQLGRKAPRKGFDAGDHPPITPTVQIPNSVGEIGSPRTWKLYELVCRNFLASISGDLLYLTKKFTFSLSRDLSRDSGGGKNPKDENFKNFSVQFTMSDRRLIDAGFQRVLQGTVFSYEIRMQFSVLEFLTIRLYCVSHFEI